MLLRLLSCLLPIFGAWSLPSAPTATTGGPRRRLIRTPTSGSGPAAVEATRRGLLVSPVASAILYSPIASMLLTSLAELARWVSSGIAHPGNAS